MDINQVVLIGRLVRNAESKDIGNGFKVANFTLAQGKKIKEKDGSYRETSCFFDCKVFGNLVEILGQYLVKGKQIAIKGKLDQESWTTKEGQTRNKVIIIADEIQLLSDPRGQQSSSNQSFEPYDENFGY